MPYISRLTLPGKAVSVTDPYPVLPAILSSTGDTLTYDCPFCSGRHRHRALPEDCRLGAHVFRARRCRVWRRLFTAEDRAKAHWTVAWSVELVVVAWPSKSREVAYMLGFFDRLPEQAYRPIRRAA